MGRSVARACARYACAVRATEHDGAPVRPHRVVLATAAPVDAGALAHDLARHGALEVVAVAGSEEEALDLVARLAPDALLVALGGDGAGTVAAGARSTPVVVLADAHEASLVRALAAGAAGYVVGTHGADPVRIARAVRAAVAGDLLIDGAVRPAVHRLAAAEGGGVLQDPGLTPREHDVLRLAARGLASKVIAERLGTGEQNVKNLLGRVYRKLGVENRTQAAIVARQRGLVP